MEKIKIESWAELFLIFIIFLLLWFCSILVLMLLWKIIVVEVIGLPMLNFWQFVGLKILVGNFCGHPNIGNFIQFHVNKKEV